MVYCVGLTGRIASGKSTAAAYFASQGVTILSADQIAKDLTRPGEVALDDIKRHFGQTVFHDNGELNRRALRQLIMHDDVARRWLEACLHPRIRDAIEQAIAHVKGPYCVIEIPLLTARTHYPYLNRVLLIEADEALQIKRLTQRDACSIDEAQACLAAQPYRETHRMLADDCILNQGSHDAFEKELQKMHRMYLIAAQRHDSA